MQPEEATKMPYRLLHGWPVRVRCCRPACLAIATGDDAPAGRLARHPVWFGFLFYKLYFFSQ